MADRHKRETITAATCRTCGVCCVSLTDQESYADVTAEDERRLGKRFVRLNVLRTSAIDRFASSIDGARLPDGAIKTAWKKQATGVLKGFNACVCVALRGSLLSRVSCSVYERRPDVCSRAVIPGDKTCRDARRMFLRLAEEDDRG